MLIKHSSIVSLSAVALFTWACGGDTGSVGTDVCASGEQWTGGNQESPLMNPGQDCITCHASGEGPSLVAAGTVYAALHEADDCYGQSGVTVELTGANGQKLTTTTNASGNFYFNARGSSLVMPFTAKVIANGVERVMVTPQSSGNCASCHSATGDNGAAGRITVP